nr:MAG TPA: Ribosomal protein L21e [Caudoviricetes sp.]
MREFKIGDSVLIRTDLVVNHVYRTNNGAPHAYFAKQMTKYKGKKLLIVGKDYKGYICSYNEEVLGWTFVNEMFEDIEWE